MHGEVVLDHCEALLRSVEQSVLQLEPDSLIETSNLTDPNNTTELNNA
jgi:exodeoxyribonuclease VII small subunit